MWKSIAASVRQSPPFTRTRAIVRWHASIDECVHNFHYTTNLTASKTRWTKYVHLEKKRNENKSMRATRREFRHLYCFGWQVLPQLWQSHTMRNIYAIEFFFFFSFCFNRLAIGWCWRSSSFSCSVYASRCVPFIRVCCFVSMQWQMQPLHTSVLLFIEAFK